MKEIDNYIKEAENTANKLIQLQRLYTSAIKLAGLSVVEVLNASELSKDYFYRRRDSGQLTPADFLNLLETLKTAKNDNRT